MRPKIIKPTRPVRIKGTRAKLDKVNIENIKGIKRRRVIKMDNICSKYGEVGKTAELLNRAVKRSGLTMSQLSDIEEEARKEYAKSRIR